jgi:hypothetical protein
MSAEGLDEAAQPAGPGPDPPPPWFSQGLAAVGSLRASLEGPIAARLDRFFARFSDMNRGQSLEASLRAPSATPFVRLFEAYRADIGASPSDPRLLAIGEGTLLLYFYLRVQDDIVDEPNLADRGDVYTMEVLSSASVRAFGCAVGEHRGFFEFRERVLRSFATAAAWEVDVAWSGGPSFSASEPVLSFLGRKFLPLAVPLGALAFFAGRGADAAQIEAFVVELGSGLQIVNDVLNVAEDHAAKRVSPILRRLYEDGRATTSTPGGVVRALLLSGSTFDEAMESARGQLAAAAETAHRMGAGALALEARARIGFLDRVPSMLLSLCLGGGS